MKKRVWKIAACILALLAVLVAAAITETIGWRPFLGPRAPRINQSHL